MENEVRLIDANRITYQVAYLPTTHGAEKVWAATDRDIENVLTIDPESLRPKGRWIYKWDAERDPKKLFVRIICSEYNLHTGQKSNYCPNCGAKMEG